MKTVFSVLVFPLLLLWGCQNIKLQKTAPQVQHNEYYYDASSPVKEEIIDTPSDDDTVDDQELLLDETITPENTLGIAPTPNTVVGQ